MSDAGRRMRVSDERDPLLMHHWVDRWDVGLDSYSKAEVVATLHDLIDRLERPAESPDAGWVDAGGTL